MTPTSDRRCALTRAGAVQETAAARGFDWTEPAGALRKVREETDEVAALLAGDSGPEPAAVPEAERGRADAPEADPRLRGEVGDLLFAVVNVARLAGIDPAAALERATAKFGRRFAEVERLARLRGLPMPGTPLPLLDRIWDEVKAGESQ